MAEPNEAYLLVTIGAERKRFALPRGVPCNIGRSQQNTIVLDDNQVSRNHAMVQSTEAGGYYLTDLGSRNGTLVNKKRATAPVLLQPGDRVLIGSHQFEFHGPDVAHTGQTGFSETMLDVTYGTITVLVTDIRGFTQLSQSLGEARLSQAMSGLFRECGSVLNQQGAREQKYIGDAIMAFWIHQDDPPHPREMIPVFQALKRIFEIVAGLQGRFDLDRPIRIGAGVNTGLACIGNIGSATASDYTAISDAVNLSFRLESATKQIGCDVALGPETYKILSSQVNVNDLLELRMTHLKGYEGPLRVYGGSRNSVDALVEILLRKFPRDQGDRPTMMGSPEVTP